MRKRTKAFRSCAVVAGALLAAAGATAQSANDTCDAGAYRIKAIGPTVATCVGDPCTTITYQVIAGGTPDHIATLVSSLNCTQQSILAVTGGSGAAGNNRYPPTIGDSVTGLGKASCHEEAARINPSGSVVNFTVTVAGQRSAARKTVVTKKGGTTRSCEIVGIGEQYTSQVAPVTETITEPGTDCAVEFTLDRLTGKVLHAQVVSSNPECTLNETPVENLELSVSGLTNCPTGSQLPDGKCSLGAAKFGEGYVHSGTGSCTTRIIGGKLYSWGAPCPE